MVLLLTRSNLRTNTNKRSMREYEKFTTKKKSLLFVKIFASYCNFMNELYFFTMILLETEAFKCFFIYTLRVTRSCSSIRCYFCIETEGCTVLLLFNLNSQELE